MAKRVSGYGRLVFFATLAGLTVLYLSPRLQRILLFRIEPTLLEVVYRIETAPDRVAQWFRGLFPQSLFSSDVADENRRLRLTIAQMKKTQERLTEEAASVKRLKSLLGYKTRSPSPLVIASVIGREASHWYETLTLDKGEADGIAVGMGVVSPEGIVGRVSKTGPSYAQVLLITDRNSAVAVIVQRTRDEGIVQGISNGSVRLKYLSHFSDAKPNDTVITSGLEGGFTKGLTVGRITEVKKQTDTALLQITITPSADLTRLEEVLIIAGNKT